MEIDGWFIRSPQRKVVRGPWGGSSSLPLLPIPTPQSLSSLGFCHLHLLHVRLGDAVKTETKSERRANRGAASAHSRLRRTWRVTVWRGLRGAQMPRRAASARSSRAASSERCLNGGAAGSSCCGGEDRPRPPSVSLLAHPAR